MRTASGVIVSPAHDRLVKIVSVQTSAVNVALISGSIDTFVSPNAQLLSGSHALTRTPPWALTRKFAANSNPI